ncbi:uncharacterized protein C5orf34 homolog [Mugil cephalus]|uniref:uncharacterized protein C5orf34 homolog n=1 Tax=Mugil cephalus TaxID=48193 RepID=UPI001FB6B22E|nr:uncharacterized protein C5orf34 homolog [Mugil cephalus]
METDAAVSLMIMYEDESVDVRYGNGARLQLSPCGCEFTLVKAQDPRGHPLQPPERVRQRTRFTVSTYKELIVAALEFRNKYATRPYLPEELISADHKKPFFSIDSVVRWPEWSSCEPELGPRGEAVVRSEEGQATLVLSPSGEEFTVEFTCALSHTHSQHRSEPLSRRDPGGCQDGQQQGNDPICGSTGDLTRDCHQGRGSRKKETTRSRSCSPGIISAAELKPEQMYQSTTVIQHHSCCAVAPMWAYPLSLAWHHWTARFSKPTDVEGEETSNSNRADIRKNMLDVSSEERRSCLPQALPLTCPSPHWHRWRVKDPLGKEEHSDLPTELVKILWCQGVTYRILSGAFSVVEVSPGDGSVIRSNGLLSSYFTHHKPELQSKQVREVTYHLNSLPPDVLGQVYSVCSIVSRANRILMCYNQTKQLLKLHAAPSCLEEDRGFSKPKTYEDNLPNVAVVEQHMNVTQVPDSRSDMVAAELEKIKRFNFLMDNNHLFATEKEHTDSHSSSAGFTHEPVDETCIAEALQRTSKAIQDIDALIASAALT